MSKISFTVAVGIRGPIEPNVYQVRDKSVSVSYPETMFVMPSINFQLPKSLSTVFVVFWEDQDGSTSKQLLAKSFEQHLPIYEVLETISELLLAFKLVRVGHIDGRGLRTVGIGDTLIFYSTVDGVQAGGVNIGMKDYAGNNGWQNANTLFDPFGTSQLAAAHIGTETLPLARCYVRCFELLEHGFYSEAFIVAFSILDDFVQKMLHELLESKGFASRNERNELLRGIKENRLKLYLGPVLKLVAGSDISTM